ELRWNHHRFLRGVPIDQLLQNLKRTLTDLLYVLVNDAQRWILQPENWVVIKPNELHILTDLQIHLMKSQQRTDGHHGVTSDNRIGSLLDQHLDAVISRFL